MSELGLLCACAIMFFFSMIVHRAEKTVLTAPIFFLGSGYVLSFTGFFDPVETEQAIHLFAEVTLIILLFLDASQINLKALRHDIIWPERMLVFGLPLSILFGTVSGIVFLDGWPIAAVALVAALLAPTDAALGQSVVTNKAVPERVRRSLTVESGLNDGLALPAVLLFASLSAESMDPTSRNWLLFGTQQILLGPVAGIIIGYGGGLAIKFAHKRHLTSNLFEGISALTLAGSAFLVAGLIGGNGFIAAFVGGLVFGNIVKGGCRFLYAFTESEGQFLMWGAFLLIGIALLPHAIASLTVPVALLILVSLFIVRPLAIWISLTSTGASAVTRLFFGWFGPRGLATALFALMVASQIDHELADEILIIAINTVWISALLHGTSAIPISSLYAAVVTKMGDCDEKKPLSRKFDNTTQDVLRTHEQPKTGD